MRPELSRRALLLAGGAGALAGAALGSARARAQEAQPQPAAAPADPLAPAPITSPNGSRLPWRWVDGVKVFHLIAEPVVREFAPGLTVQCWGYNGQTPGPLIEATEGDRVRIYVTNKLPEPTTVHWHGLLVPSGMDGVAGLSQPRIEPGQTFQYEFALRQSGSFMYHPHFDEMVQMGLGMMGMFAVHPREPRGPRVDRDYAILLSEWAIEPGTERPNPLEMTEFNVLTMNSKVYPATAPLVAQTGERVRIRLGNLSAMSHHSLHLHGFQFRVTHTDGGAIPESAQWPETTVIVPVGTTRTLEFVADAPGDWAFHCHMTHHVMNQMGHGLPNMIGVPSGPADRAIQALLPEYMAMGQRGMGEMSEMSGMAVPRNSIPMRGGRGPHGAIDMGGMFTLLKVRERLPADGGDPGWYAAPAGSTARALTAAELRRAGLEGV